MKHKLLSLLLLVFMTTTVIAQTDSIAIQDQVANTEQAIADTLSRQASDTNQSWFKNTVSNVTDWYNANMNYYTVAGLMTIESSFIPFPSEIVIPPAVYASEKGSSPMKVWLIVLFGTIGAMLGAFINYYLSRWLGRPVIYKFVDSKVGHLFLLSAEKMEKAEAYFNKHGNISTLVGRMVPVVRQLISIPAGLSRMNVGAFALFTFVGAFAWNCILGLIGWLAYRAGTLSVVKEYSDTISYILAGVVGLVIVWIVVKKILKKRNNKQ